MFLLYSLTNFTTTKRRGGGQGQHIGKDKEVKEKRQRKEEENGKKYDVNLPYGGIKIYL